MSGISETCPCPNCGASADLYTDWKPFDYSVITCRECGLHIYPKLSYMTLDELNDFRLEQGLEELSELPKQEDDIW